jgi:flagellar basal body-associated protein FliL
MTLKNSGRSVVIRIAAVAVVLLAAYLYYHFFAVRAETAATTARIPNVVKWEESRRPFWNTLKYISLSDRDAIRDSLGKSVAGSPLLSGLTQPQKTALIESSVVAIQSLRAETPDEYLEAILPLRRLRSDVKDDTHLLLSYKMLTGQPVSVDMSPRDLLTVFLQGRPDLQSRATEISVGDSRGIVLALGEWDGKSRERWKDDSNWTEEWANEASTSFVRLTEPPETPSSLIERNGSVLRLSMSFVVRNADEHCVPLYFGFCWDPGAESWCFESAYIQTDEPLFWPI